jgi:hypothetical protein
MLDPCALSRENTLKQRLAPVAADRVAIVHDKVGEKISRR